MQMNEGSHLVCWEAFMNHTWKMHTKILLLCLGVTFFALILQMLLFQETSSEMIYQQAKTESFHSLQNMQDDVYNLMKRVEKVLIESYNKQDFIQDLKNERDIGQMRCEKNIPERLIILPLRTLRLRTVWWRCICIIPNMRSSAPTAVPLPPDIIILWTFIRMRSCTIPKL